MRRGHGGCLVPGDVMRCIALFGKASAIMGLVVMTTFKNLGDTWSTWRDRVWGCK
jgi:hypothetical protein